MQNFNNLAYTAGNILQDKSNAKLIVSATLAVLGIINIGMSGFLISKIKDFKEEEGFTSNHSNIAKAMLAMTAIICFLFLLYIFFFQKGVSDGFGGCKTNITTVEKTLLFASLCAVLVETFFAYGFFMITEGKNEENKWSDEQIEAGKKNLIGFISVNCIVTVVMIGIFIYTYKKRSSSLVAGALSAAPMLMQ
jgi:hypothetical protein